MVRKTRAIPVWASYFGDPQLALKTYRQMAQQGNLIVWTVWRALEKDMRRLPGFKDLLRDLGLVDYWRSTGNWGDFCRPLGDADFECE